jgi:hypothetical protein
MKIIHLTQWTRGIRRWSATTPLLEMWGVRIPPGAWMSICCWCCVLSGKGLCVGLITCYNKGGASECDCQASIMRRPSHYWGCCIIVKNKFYLSARPSVFMSPSTSQNRLAYSCNDKNSCPLSRLIDHWSALILSLCICFCFANMADADGSVEHCPSQGGKLTHEFILLTPFRNVRCNVRRAVRAEPNVWKVW